MNVHIVDASPDQEDVRDGLERELTRRWVLTAREVRRSILAHDALGIGDKAPQSAMPSGDKAEMFRRWLNERLSVGVGGYDGSWLETFVNRASTRGAGAALADFDPDEPRNEAGRWTSSGFASTLGNPAFKAWFGKSKILTGGRPLVVFHGSDVDVSSFEGDIHWFSAKPELASEYATTKARLRQGGNGASIYPAFLRMERPLDLKENMNDSVTFAQLRKSVGFHVPVMKYGDEFVEGVEQKYKVHQIVNSEEFISAAKTAGYDGVRAKEGRSSTYGVFDPRQIKSAIGNKGTFDPKSPRLIDATQAGIAFLLPSGPAPSSKVCHGAAVGALAGICEDVSDQAHEAVANGLLARIHPRKIARMVDHAMGQGLKRSRQLAEHSVTQAFTQATLDALEASGVTHVGTVSERKRKRLWDAEDDEVIVEGQDGALFRVVRRGDEWVVIQLGDSDPPIYMGQYGTRYEDVTYYVDAPRKNPQPKHPRSGKFAKAHIVAREMRRSKRTGRFRKQGLAAEEQRKEELAEARFGRVAGEFDVLTAGDDRVCDVCDGISENGPYTINEARGLIPAHPNCRCVFVAAGSMQDAGPDDEPRDEQGRWTSSAMQLTAGMKGESGYVYHVTNEERLGDIADEGALRTHKADEFTDQDAWPDGSTEKRAYFSERPLDYFAPEEGRPVVIRTPRGAHIKIERGTGDLYSTKPIPAKQIEYLHQNGQWRPLPSKVADFDPDEPRDERGRWSTSGGKAKELEGGGRPDPGDRPPEFSRVPNEEVAASLVWGEKVKERVLAQAAADGYPARHIEVLSYPNSNLLAGANYNTLAWYDPNTGKIQVFADAMPRTAEAGTANTVEGTASHEIMHAKTDWWLKMNPSIETKLKDEIGFGSNSLDRPLGKGFATPRKLMGDDGVTPYSTRTWEQWLNSQDPSKSRSRRLPFDLPFGETISEMRAVQRETGRLPGTDSWKAIYQDIEDEWEHGQSTDLVGIELNPRVRPDDDSVTVTRVKH